MEDNSKIIDQYFNEFIQTNASVESAKVELENAQKLLKIRQSERLDFFKKLNDLDSDTRTKIVKYAEERLSGSFFETDEAQKTVKGILKCLACRFNKTCAEKNIIFSESCSSL